MNHVEAHLINLGPCETCGSKQYLTVRQRKKGLLVYLILEDSDGKRKYRQVTKIPNSLLRNHHSGNAESSDKDSFEILTAQLRTIESQLSRAVTDFEKRNIQSRKREPDSKVQPFINRMYSEASK